MCCAEQHLRVQEDFPSHFHTLISVDKHIFPLFQHRAQKKSNHAYKKFL